MPLFPFSLLKSRFGKFSCLFTVFISMINAVSGQTSLKNEPIIRIDFNEKGQMTSTPPAFITSQDKIIFQVTVTDEFNQNRIIQIYKIFQQTLNQLNQSDGATKNQALKTLGLENTSATDQSRNAAEILLITERKLAENLDAFLTKHRDILSLQLDPDKEHKALLVYEGHAIDALLSKYPDLFYLPDMEDLVVPKYTVVCQVENVNGLDMESKCNTPLVLAPGCNTCGTQFTNSLMLDDITKGPVRLKFELRLDNNILSTLIKQVKNNALINAAFLAKNPLDIVKNINNILNFSNVSGQAGIDQPTIDALNKWIIAKESQAAKPADHQTHKTQNEPAKDKKAADTPPPIPDVTLTPDQVTAITKSLQTIDGLAVQLQTKEILAWIFQLSWLTGGQQLTANPVGYHISATTGKQTSDANNQLKSLLQDSARIQSELTLLENVSKAGGAANDLKTLTLKYDTLQLAKKAMVKSLEDQRAALKKLKSNLPDELVSQLNKGLALSDSLFYRGYLYINHQDGKKKAWFALSPESRDYAYFPNRNYYAFMRSHDALEDFQLKGKDPVKGINETQRLYILIDNAQDKSKYLLKTTIANIAPSADIDQLGVGVGAQLNTNVIRAPAAPTAMDDLFTLYEKEKKIAGFALSPFSNGLFSLPFKVTPDKTPDYVTKPLSHESPFKAPSTVSYQIIDSAKAKNMNSEGTVYTYRFNKLYRFRIKAGIAYSFLQNRTYAVNPTLNTVSYTTNYTGLEPALGIQIFTTRLDIQSTRLFPHGAAPFIYLGYLYHNAPGTNFLLGAGWEVFSGFAISGGVHYGLSQRLAIDDGTPQPQNYYKPAAFVSLDIGLEAFNALFNTAKPTVNPFK